MQSYSGAGAILEEEERDADLVNEGTRRELAASGAMDAFSPPSAYKVNKQIVQTRRVLTWEMVEGKKCVKARLVARGV